MTHNKSLDASGDGLFLNQLGAAQGALIRAAASTQTLGCSLYRLQVAMRIAFIFLLTAVVATAQTSSTLRQKYGQPTSETYDGEPTEIYKVRPDIKVTVRYTKRGDVCSMFIGPASETTNGKPSLLKSQPLDEVIDELVPEDQRGTHIMDTFLNITCLPNNDCYGTRRDYERLLIVHNGSIDAYRYASIEWKHRKCQTPAPTKRAK